MYQPGFAVYIALGRLWFANGVGRYYEKVSRYWKRNDPSGSSKTKKLGLLSVISSN
jgi:hypothetical protein